MRVVTESDAEELVCPYKSGNQLKCIASKCMAWQPYSPSNMVDIIKSGFSIKGNQGFCDYNGFATPTIIGTVGAVRNENK